MIMAKNGDRRPGFRNIVLRNLYIYIFRFVSSENISLFALNFYDRESISKPEWRLDRNVRTSLDFIIFEIEITNHWASTNGIACMFFYLMLKTVV